MELGFCHMKVEWNERNVKEIKENQAHLYMYSVNSLNWSFECTPYEGFQLYKCKWNERNIKKKRKQEKNKI